MKVSGVEWVEKRDSITVKTKKYLTTFFELTASEQRKYDAFRAKHDDLKKRIDKSEKKLLGTREREDDEKELSEIFLDLVNPYFQERGLEAITSFTCYGEPRETIVEVPKYILFKDGKPFDSTIDFNFWFLTQDENLSCRSYFSHGNSRKFYPVIEPETNIIHELLKKVVEKIKQDGINFPILSFQGSFVYFASTNFAVPLMSLTKNILEKIDPESMKELNVLYREYIRYSSKSGLSDTTVQKRVFKEAYENKLEEIVNGYKLLMQADSLIRA